MTMDKKSFNKIKKFFLSREQSVIDQGLEVYRSLQSVEISNSFLDGVTYSTKYSGKIIPNTIFTGTKPAQPFINYALLGVIAYAPDDCELANELKNRVKSLNIEIINSSPLSEFKNLESLNLNDSELLKELDGIGPLKKLKHIEINKCSELKSNLKNLESLLDKNLEMTSFDLNDFSSLENLDGIQSIAKLKTLDISNCYGLKNVNALKDLAHLENVVFDSLNSLESLDNLKSTATDVNLWGYDELKDLDGIQNIHKLEILSVGCENISDISALRGMKFIKRIDLRCGEKLLSLKGIDSLPALEELYIDSRVITSLKGLKNLKNLKLVNLECDELVNLEGLEEANNVSELVITSKKLSNISNIASLTKLKNIDLSECESIESLVGLEKLNSLETLSVNNCPSLISLNGPKNPQAFYNKGRYSIGLRVDLDGCSSLEDITALKGIPSIEKMYLNGCSSINKTEGLESTKIEYIRCQDISEMTLKSLSNLDVRYLDWHYMQKLPFEGLKEWPSVSDLQIREGSFENLLGIGAFVNATYLDLSKNTKLKSLEGIEELKHLKELDLSNCNEIEDVNALSELTNLDKLNMDGCSKLSPLPRPKIMEDNEKVQKYQLRLLQALGKQAPVSLKKKSTGTKNNKPLVDKKVLSKIKKLLTSRDIGLIDQGLELVNSLADQSLYDELLKGVEYKFSKNKWGDGEEGRIVPNSMFTGTGPAQPYLDYAIRGLINDAQNGFAQNLRNEITELVNIDILGDISNFTNLKKLDIAYPRDENSPASISLSKFSNFKELISLTISIDIVGDKDMSAFSNINKLEHLSFYNKVSFKTLTGIEKCSKLKTLSISEAPELENFEGLGSCKKLSSIEITGYESGSKKLKNLDALSGLQSLKEIRLDHTLSLENIDGLKGIKSLTNISITEADSLKNIDGLKGCSSLEELVIRCESKSLIQNLDGIKGLKKISNIELSGLDSLKNIDGLMNSDSLISIHLGANKLKNIDGLTGCNNLDYFNVDGDNLENLDGLKGNKVLQELTIPLAPKRLNLDGLSSMKSLKKTDFSGCNITSFGFTKKNSQIKGVNIRNCNEIISLEGLENLEGLTHIVIKDCQKLKSLKGIEGLTNLKSFIIQDCKSLKEIDLLLSLKKLKIFKMRSCGLKKDDVPGHLKIIVETTISYEDDLPHNFN